MVWEWKHSPQTFNQLGCLVRLCLKIDHNSYLFLILIRSTVRALSHTLSHLIFPTTHAVHVLLLFIQEEMLRLILFFFQLRLRDRTRYSGQVCLIPKPTFFIMMSSSPEHLESMRSDPTFLLEMKSSSSPKSPHNRESEISMCPSPNQCLSAYRCQQGKLTYQIEL